MRAPIVLVSGVVLVVAGTTGVRAQSRSATMAVSVVVRPRCVIDAGGPSDPAHVSVSCSSQGTRGVQVRIDTHSGALAPTVTGPNRLDYRITVNPAQTVLTIQF